MFNFMLVIGTRKLASIVGINHVMTISRLMQTRDGTGFYSDSHYSENRYVTAGLQL